MPVDGHLIGMPINRNLDDFEPKVVVPAMDADFGAGIAGLSSYYDNLCRFTSMAAHASPRELNTAFDVDASGKVESLRYGPLADDLDMHFDYGISMMLYTLHEAASHFDLDVVGDIEKLQRVNDTLAGPGQH